MTEAPAAKQTKSIVVVPVDRESSMLAASHGARCLRTAGWQIDHMFGPEASRFNGTME
jgi:hypothetical protein